MSLFDRVVGAVEILSILGAFWTAVRIAADGRVVGKKR